MSSAPEGTPSRRAEAGVAGAGADDAAGRCIVRRRPKPGARLRLVCFHHAGGAASAFHAWGSTLLEHVEICAVQLPGREGRWREPTYPTLDCLLAELTPALIRGVEPPYAYFGHSLGARLAFELCHEMIARGAEPPRHLFISGRRAPHLPPSRQLASLSDDDLLRELRRMGGTPDVILADRTLMKRLLATLRADLQLDEAPVDPARPPLRGPLTVFGGDDDPFAPCDELAAWQQHTVGRFALQTFPGGHFYLASAYTAFSRALIEALGAIA